MQTNLTTASGEPYPYLAMKPGTRMKNYSAPTPQGENPRRRIVKRVEPFSPWQLLVQQRCTELGLSTRALAQKIVMNGRRFEHTTIWAWLRSPEGVPPAETYTAELNRTLATAIEASPDVLAMAFEESRRKFLIATASPAQQGPLSVLRMLFAGSQRKTWKTEEIVKLIDDVRGV